MPSQVDARESINTWLMMMVTAEVTRINYLFYLLNKSPAKLRLKSNELIDDLRDVSKKLKRVSSALADWVGELEGEKEDQESGRKESLE